MVWLVDSFIYLSWVYMIHVHVVWIYDYARVKWQAYVNMQVHMCMQVCVWCSLERRMTDTYYSHVCGTVIILRASLLLGNASECPGEMIPFHTDNRIWSKQKLSLQPIYFSLPVPPLILIAAAWNTNKSNISGLLAGDKRCWNRVWDSQYQFIFNYQPQLSSSKPWLW